jgi:hypothetical protein
LNDAKTSQEPTPQAGKEDEEEDVNFADLRDDCEDEEAAAEQRALLASFETQRCDETARHFIVAERRATTKKGGGGADNRPRLSSPSQHRGSQGGDGTMPQ